MKTTVTESFISALAAVAGYVQPIAEEVHVPGYGVCSMDTCGQEAYESHKKAGEFAKQMNHGAAAYHLERAAMFHKAIAKHLETQVKENAQDQGTGAQLVKGGYQGVTTVKGQKTVGAGKVPGERTDTMIPEGRVQKHYKGLKS